MQKSVKTAQKTKKTATTDPKSTTKTPKYYKLPASIMTLGLSARACIIYAILADRQELSNGNPDFTDKEGNFYIIFQTKDLCKVAGAGERTIKYALAELEDNGLIKRKKQGRNHPQKIYVYKVQNTALYKEYKVQNTALYKEYKVQNTALPEVQNTALPIINNTDNNNTESSSTADSGRSGRGLLRLIALIDSLATAANIQLTDEQVFKVLKKTRKQGDKIGNLSAWLNTVIRNVSMLPDRDGSEDGYAATYDIGDYESTSVLDELDDEDI